VQTGYIDWSSGKPVAAFGPLADPDLDVEALLESIPTDPEKWPFDQKTGKRKDPREPALRVPVVILETGKLLTISSSAKSHLKAWQRTVGNALVQQRAAQATTMGHVPLIEIRTKAVPAQGGTAEIFILLLETMDWVPESEVIRALGRTGNAIAFGLSNEEAVNADIAEAEAELEKPKPAKRGPRL
jgi:hypothetical protein